MTDRRYTALVLAASRGNLDPLAQAGGVSHKTFIDVAGVPMLERVVRGVARMNGMAEQTTRQSDYRTIQRIQ